MVIWVTFFTTVPTATFLTPSLSSHSALFVRQEMLNEREWRTLFGRDSLDAKANRRRKWESPFILCLFWFSFLSHFPARGLFLSFIEGWRQTGSNKKRKTLAKRPKVTKVRQRERDRVKTTLFPRAVFIHSSIRSFIVD